MYEKNVKYFGKCSFVSRYCPSAQSYNPLKIGNSWVEQSDTMNGAYNPVTFTKTIPTTDSIGGEEYFQVYQKMSGGSTGHWSAWERINSTGCIMGAFGDSATGPTTPITPPLLVSPKDAVDSGTTWDFYSAIMGGHYHYLTEASNLTVTVPAGTFNNCLKFRLIVDTTSGGGGRDTTRIGYYYYAPNVGEIINQTIAPPSAVMDLKLTSYYVGTEETNKGVTPGLEILQNPFFQSTSISYFIPNLSKVELMVYDLSGREIKTLVNEEQSSGTHNVTLNAQTLLSGIYFVKLQVGNYKDTKKLILVK